jgi:hypothetical protein
MNNFDILFAKNVMQGELSNYYNKEQSDARYLQKSGGALIGDVTTSVTEFTSASLITKGYVDGIVGNINTVLEEVL